MRNIYTIRQKDGSVLEFNHDLIQEYNYSSENDKHHARVVYNNKVYNFEGMDAKSLIEQLQAQGY